MGMRWENEMGNSNEQGNPASKLMRVVLPLSAMILCLWLLQSRITLPSIDEMSQAMASVPFENWLGAGLATAVSFWSLGRYDGVAHRHLQTGLDGAQARRAGMIAIAFSQTVGFGVLSGSFARWRLLPSLTPARAAQLTVFTGLTFIVALAGLCGAALLLFMPFITVGWLGALLLVSCLATLATSFVWPEVQFKSITLRWPSLFALSGLTLWAVIDITAAGTALWLLLPADSGISLQMLLPAYFIALGLAVISSAPGGTGPLELGLITLLSAHDPALILSGIVSFRLVYYALPALFSGLFLLWPQLLGNLPRLKPNAALSDTCYDPAHTIPFSRPRSETAVIRQNGGHLQRFKDTQIAVLNTPQTSVALFDPIAGPSESLFAALIQYSKARNAATCLYKCSPKIALSARNANWKILRIASEAVISPLKFEETGSSKRQLRRKLRNAQKAGIEVRHAANTPPLDQLADVDAKWRAAHGRALGTTMGQFERNYIAAQEIFIAWKDNAIIGFASFHTSDREWCLDLIRMGADAPDGTGHALMRAAIDAASEQNIARLSLAAVPDHKYAERVDRGLRRFKSCFAPRWEPQYIAAPTWPQLALCLLELIRLVHRPKPIQPALTWAPSDQTQQVSDGDSSLVHNQDEENAIAIAKRA